MKTNAFSIISSPTSTSTHEAPELLPGDSPFSEYPKSVVHACGHPDEVVGKITEWAAAHIPCSKCLGTIQQTRLKMAWDKGRIAALGHGFDIGEYHG